MKREGNNQRVNKESGEGNREEVTESMIAKIIITHAYWAYTMYPM